MRKVGELKSKEKLGVGFLPLIPFPYYDQGEILN